MLKKSLTGFGLLLASGLLLPLHAQTTDDEAEKEWAEVALHLPGAPDASNLVSFYASGSQSFAIDVKSLSITGDGIIRYSLVAVSSSGAKNVSYEGIRCSTYEKKLYAFGRPDGSWSRSRRNQWDHISALNVNKQHSTLFNDYFCDGNSIAGKASVIIDRIKRHQVIKPY
ncbi:CNP1-like family protein [Undibacterium sp. Jales W-56]|uniref:CNP1-like family protein n=1 Tax=Undibacterium sp. Jales W-56 TaxID=2897325 RepID=UPI0021D004A7|nr:CNP1-like family protein [Undibacterium sp. Jales W-56]MCU6432347.1 CNP1-like family protein [Undibacterium sp. Jales W-56]